MKSDVIKMVDKKYLSKNKRVHSGDTHNNDCDVNPIDLTWRKSVPSGYLAKICTNCLERIRVKYQMNKSK